MARQAKVRYLLVVCFVVPTTFREERANSELDCSFEGIKNLCFAKLNAGTWMTDNYIFFKRILFGDFCRVWLKDFRQLKSFFSSLDSVTGISARPALSRESRTDLTVRVSTSRAGW